MKSCGYCITFQKKECINHGFFKCVNYIPKEKPMSDKVIFNNKQEVIEMFNSIGYTISPENLNALKRQGYIRKPPVEKAEEHYKMYVSCARGMCDKEDGQYILIEELWEAVQYLKAENERLNNAIYKS